MFRKVLKIPLQIANTGGFKGSLWETTAPDPAFLVARSDSARKKKMKMEKKIFDFKQKK